MKKVFEPQDLDLIAKVMETGYKNKSSNYRFVIDNKDTGQHLSLEIYPDIPIGKKTGNLVSVYTPNSHLQLQFCTDYVISELLGEVTFVAQVADKISGLIIDKNASCSFYSNVDNELLSGDFTQLGPEVMLSGIALSLAENMFSDKEPLE